MKRYWKLAVLIPFIALSTGMYYITESGGNRPEFYLKTMAGDEKEATSLDVKADFGMEILSINTQGSTYRNELISYWETLYTHRNHNEELRRLVKEHRQFMRGKTDISVLYQSDTILGYVDENHDDNLGMQSDVFTVSLLDKSKNVSSSFDIKLPKKNVQEIIHISDVQIKGQTMKLLANVWGRGQSTNSEQVRQYTVDLDQKRLVEDRMLLPNISEDKDIQISVEEVYKPDPYKKTNYAVFELTHLKKGETKSPESDTNNVVHRELVVYDKRSETLKKVDHAQIHTFLNKKKNPEDLFIRQSGDDLYFALWSNEKGPKILYYNIADNKVKNEVSIALQANRHDVNVSRIANNRLYLLVRSHVAPKVIVAELETGKIVYQGAVSRKDNNETNNLGLNNFTLQ
ncbi:hypothetical protein [Paenibacillus sp. 481]|uniref:hypothetical protein n=1 Tax=Paenibacillus sp. 481 TaxID=2835869 RepID=UPI001E365471|nr:hypothetical protein [Paenibacillus sp. 481]UHA75453.1 hypothetical protein KIK04_10885 [Paenibacillus sp. 481]